MIRVASSAFVTPGTQMDLLPPTGDRSTWALLLDVASVALHFDDPADLVRLRELLIEEGPR